MSRCKFFVCAFLFVAASSMFVVNAKDGIIATVAGDGDSQWAGDEGLAINASFQKIVATAFLPDSSQIVVDAGASVIRKIDPSGIITTICGGYDEAYWGDGGPAIDAKVAFPSDVDVDSAGNIYIADAGNNVVRRITTDGIISTFAGTGVAGYTGEGTPAIASNLDHPSGIAVDSHDNVYIVNKVWGLVQVVDQSGWLEIFAGDLERHGLYVGDGGPAREAGLSGPTDITVGPDGSVYILEQEGNRIRRVDSSGIITTYAGTGVSGYAGDGGSAAGAQFNFDPEESSKMACDALGNLYVADSGNHAIRLVDPSCCITTVAGKGVPGYSGDNRWAFNGELQFPYGVACKPQGNIVISDTYNYRIREVNMNFEAPAGSNAAVSIGEEVSMVFNSIESPGEVTVDVRAAYEPPAPGELSINGSYVDISTTAGFSGDITITLKYNDVTPLDDADDLNQKVLHYSSEENAWKDATIGVRPVVDEIDARVNSLSPFAIVSVPSGYAFVNFRRGDANDDGGHDISDAVFTLLYLFAGSAQSDCLDSMDVNDDGEIDISDPVAFLMYLFLDGANIKSPGPNGTGLDPTTDSLDCKSYKSS